MVGDETAGGIQDGWREKLPLLACGLLTPHQGNEIVAAAAAPRLNDVELIYRAFRSLSVALISDQAPSYMLVEWARVIKSMSAMTQREFPAATERFVSLRCMLLEAAEQEDWKAGEHAARPAVGDITSLLAAHMVPMTARGISEALGLDEHAVAKRLRLAILTGRVVAHYDDWKTVRFSSAAAAA